MRANDFIKKLVRPLIGDTESPYRTPDINIMPFVSAGLLDMFGRRPEAFYVTDIVTTAPAFDDANTNAEIPITDRYLQGLANYVAWKLFMHNTEDANNVALSEKHAALYGAEITG